MADTNNDVTHIRGVRFGAQIRETLGVVSRLAAHRAAHRRTLNELCVLTDMDLADLAIAGVAPDQV